MRVLIALDINDTDLRDAGATQANVRAGLVARLGEFYPVGGMEVRASTLAVGDVTDSYRLFVDALMVGVDGIDADDDLRESVGYTQEQVEQVRQAMVALGQPLATGA